MLEHIDYKAERLPEKGEYIISVGKNDAEKFERVMELETDVAWKFHHEDPGRYHYRVRFPQPPSPAEENSPTEEKFFLRPTDDPNELLRRELEKKAV